MSQDQPQKKVSSQSSSQESEPKQEPTPKKASSTAEGYEVPKGEGYEVPKGEGYEVPKGEGYEVPKGEEGLFHVEMEPASGRYNPDTGEKRHKAYVQKFHPKDFALQISTNDKGEPIYATVGLRINKFLHKPAAELLKDVRVDTIQDKKKVIVPITEMLLRIDSIIEKQPK